MLLVGGHLKGQAETGKSTLERKPSSLNHRGFFES